MKNQPLRKLPLLALASAAVLVLSITSALADTVKLAPADEKAPTQTQKNNPDSPAWHRKLWVGSFDKAADATGVAAKTLENLDFGDCSEYLKEKDGKPGDQNVYNACVQRKQASVNFAEQARSIQKQQKVMSMVSKASDVAAVGAIGGVAYAELGVKNGKDSNTYEKAARIQKTAGQVSYAAGATDFAMGAYAYIAHKNKLNSMKNTISGTAGGVKAESDGNAGSALSNAVEASKKAAYNHMLYGAGKMAVGYASMYLSKKSAAQAEKMQNLQELQELNEIAKLRAQRLGSAAVAQQTVTIENGGSMPYYQNNQPAFIMPNSSGTSQTAATGGPVTYTMPGGGSGSGSSVAPGGGTFQRAPSSANSGKISGGGGGGAEGSGGAKLPENEDPAKEKAVKEAVGSTFETQLTGGMKSYSGTGSSSSATPEVPNLAAMMGGSDPTVGAGTGPTTLSPSQMMNEALEGTEGTEQGSMAGVSGKRETSLFDITKAKLTKMFQVGNVGIPKNVEVKN